MTDPLFWLVLSLLFVTASLTIVLAVAIPALRELARAARSAEKLFDTLRREFPPTLESIRLTGMEISDLTDDVSEGVQSAGNVVKQVDESLTNVRKQAQRVQSGTRSVMVGIKVAWRTFTRSQKPPVQRRQVDRLPPPRPELNLDEQPTVDPYLASSHNQSFTAPEGRSRRLANDDVYPTEPSPARHPSSRSVPPTDLSHDYSNLHDDDLDEYEE